MCYFRILLWRTRLTMRSEMVIQARTRRNSCISSRTSCPPAYLQPNLRTVCRSSCRFSKRPLCQKGIDTIQYPIHRVAHHHNSGPRLADTLSALGRLAKACSRLYKIMEYPNIALFGTRALSSVSLVIDISRTSPEGMQSK